MTGYEAFVAFGVEDAISLFWAAALQFMWLIGDHDAPDGKAMLGTQCALATVYGLLRACADIAL